MKFWQSIAWAEVEQLTGIAKCAEEVGFYGAIGGDHLFLSKALDSEYPYTGDGKMNYTMDYPFPDVWASMAAMAAVTTTLHFTSSIFILPLRNPIEVAKQIGTVAQISGNRVALGCGIGWHKAEYDSMGVDFHTRGKRMVECIEVCRTYWKGGVVSHHGEFFNFDEIYATPVPTAPVPIYYGGTADVALRRAAQMCDGFIGPGHKLDQVAPLMAELKRLRKEAGREREPFEAIFLLRPVAPLPDVDTLKRLEDAGVTGIITPPFDADAVDRGQTHSGLGRFSTLAQKRRRMEDYAETTIRKVNG
jgi:probable F420-dependent oxidoreductase